MGGGGGFGMGGGPGMRHDYGGYPMDGSPFGPGGMMGFGGPMQSPMGMGGPMGGRFNKFSNTTDYGGFSSESYGTGIGGGGGAGGGGGGFRGGFGRGGRSESFFSSRGCNFNMNLFTSILINACFF